MVVASARGRNATLTSKAETPSRPAPYQTRLAMLATLIALPAVVLAHSSAQEELLGSWEGFAVVGTQRTPIGWTISHAVLALLYYLLFTPIGLIIRLFGRDPMQRRLDRSAATYWVPHNQDRDAGRYFRQF